MSKNRRQAKAAHRHGKGAKPVTPSPAQSSSTIDSGAPDNQVTRTSGEETARGWRVWLKEKPYPQKTVNNPAPAENISIRSALSDLDGVVDVAAAPPEKSPEIASSTWDTGENADPSSVDAENKSIETRKENNMQTAQKDETIVNDSAQVKVDLRDAPSAKVSALKEVATLQDDDIGSLFGPVIEDDVKGVRSQIRELIQCEMQGELGQRFSRNLRIVIRREIAAAIDDQFDRV